jgi:hypothetical protein
MKLSSTLDNVVLAICMAFVFIILILSMSCCTMSNVDNDAVNESSGMITMNLDHRPVDDIVSVVFVKKIVTGIPIVNSEEAIFVVIDKRKSEEKGVPAVTFLFTDNGIDFTSIGDNIIVRHWPEEANKFTTSEQRKIRNLIEN